MAGFGSAVRLFTRSPSVRSAAVRLSSGVKSSPFRLSATKPLSHRIFRCPVELSVCLETVQPFHSLSASVLMTPVLIVSRCNYCLLPEAICEGVSHDMSTVILLKDPNSASADKRETVARFMDFSAVAIRFMKAPFGYRQLACYNKSLDYSPKENKKHKGGMV